MRASEFAINEGRASRRKQARMIAKNQPIAPAVQPTASTGTSAPAVAPNTQPTPSSGTDWNALNQATAPAKPSVGSSMMNTLKQKAMSAGKGIANKFSAQNKISAKTDQIFMDKFLKDMAKAEQTSTGLRGEPFDVNTWVSKYLAQNKWQAGEQQTALDSAIASNNKKAIAKSMAAIGKYNNLGSTIKSQGAMNNMANQLATNTTPSPTTQPAAQTSGGPLGQMASQLTKPATPSEPIKIGKHTLDPKDPTDAKMIAMIQKQGNK